MKTAVMAAGTIDVARRTKSAATILLLAGSLAVATGCVDDSGGPSNQTTGTVLGAGLGAAVGGLAFHSWGGAIGGALVGALAGNLVGRALDDRERQRLAEATQQAFVADTNQPTTYTVPPANQPPATASGSVSGTNVSTSSQATVVSAKPVGPAAAKPDGSTCRPIELTATKNGQTTTQTTTFCQAKGSNDLKPVSV
jgi:surface antigen